MKKTEKPWGSTFLRSSMFWRSWLFKEHVKPVSRRKQHWNCWGQPTVLVFHLEGIAGQLQCASAILRQQPCKLNPCPIVCYVLVLTKEQGKGKWALPKKNLAKALDDYLAKEGCLEDPFSKQILRNYQPCVSTPELLNNTKNVSINKTLSSSTLAQYFSCNLLGTSHEQLWPWSCSVLETIKEMHKLLHFGLGWDDIEGHLLKHFLKPIHAVK